MSAYSDVKEVATDAWGVGKSAAEYVFGEKDITGTPTRPSNGEMVDAEDLAPGASGNPYKPTSGNQTFDTVLEWFI